MLCGAYLSTPQDPEGRLKRVSRLASISRSLLERPCPAAGQAARSGAADILLAMRLRHLAATYFAALAAAAPPLSAQSPARVDTAVAIPMRDSILLRADIYRPSGSARVPVLVD